MRSHDTPAFNLKPYSKLETNLPYAIILLVEDPDDDQLTRVVSSLHDQYSHLVEATGLANLSPTIQSAVEKGADEIVILPLFLQFPGRLEGELSREVQASKVASPQAQIALAPTIGFGQGIQDLLANRVGQAISSLEGSAGVPILEIGGPMASPTAFSYPDFRKLPDQIPDVSRLISGRLGSGVWVRTLLDRVGVKPGATYAVFYSREDGFSAHVPLKDLCENGLMIYQLDGQPLPTRAGGPLRLLVPGAKDRCANIKGVSRLEITSESNRPGGTDST